MTKKIIITGAAGTVSQPVIEALQSQYSLKLFDRLTRVSHVNQTRNIEKLDITNSRKTIQKIQDADILIHLAAIPDEDKAPRIIKNNIIGTLNIFEAARLNNIKHVILTSSILTYGDPSCYSAGGALNPQKHTNPGTHYAVSKLYAENLGQMYSSMHGLSVICIRLGWYPRADAVKNLIRKYYHSLLSSNDCKRLFLRSVASPEVKYAVVNGVSYASENYFDLEPGHRLLSFEPQDTVEMALQEHLQRLRRLESGC